MKPFFTQFVLLHASDNTTSQNIGGGDGCMGRPPISNLGEPSPQPPKFPPMGPDDGCVPSWFYNY